MLAKITQAGKNISTHLLSLFEIRKKCHKIGWKLLLYLLIRRVIKVSVVIIEGYHYYQLCPIFLFQC